jgi:hypothetical protein
MRRDLFLPILPQAGERFDKVAQECSEDKAKGTVPRLAQFMFSYSNLIL